MRTIHLHNDFHNTTATVRLNPDGILTPSQVKRAHQRLCPFASTPNNCACSGDLGTRGPQEVRVVVLFGREMPGCNEEGQVTYRVL